MERSNFLFLVLGDNDVFVNDFEFEVIEVI